MVCCAVADCPAPAGSDELTASSAAPPPSNKPKFEFEDVGRKIDMEKYKHVPNPPVYMAPLGACDVPHMSLKSVKKELRKRLVECSTCKTKADYQVALRDAITAQAPTMSEEDYARYLVWEAEQAQQGGQQDSTGAAGEL